MSGLLSSGRQKTTCGCPPSVARSQKAGNGIPDIYFFGGYLMKKKIGTVVALLVVLGIFSIIASEIIKPKKTNETKATDDSANSDTEYYTYALIEKDVSYLANSSDEEKELSRLIDPLGKSNYITVKYVKAVVETINLSEDVYSEILAGKVDEDYVSVEEFENIYLNIVKTGKINSLSMKTLFVFDVIEQTDETGKYKSVLSDGNQEYELAVVLTGDCVNQVLDVYVKDGVIFKIRGLSEQNVQLSNVWVISVEENICTCLYKQTQRELVLSYSMSEEDIPAGKLVQLSVGNVGITDVQEYEKSIKARVLEVTEDKIQVENKGGYTYDDIMIYDITQGEVPVCINSPWILKGYPEVELIVEGNTIVAGIIDGELTTDNIRVILSNDNYTSYKVPEITFYCEGDLTIKYSDDGESTHSGGKAITIKYTDYEDGDVITIEPDNPKDDIQILSISRSCGNPVYDGIIEVNIFEDGMHIINELPLETYLYSVVSSEMSTDSSMEALKAEAVCARGYAYIKMKDGSFDDYDAHLDDSTLCQLYNNVATTDNCIKAVNDTYGIVPVYNDKVIVPLHFSTSAGTLCTNDDIWGGESYPYYRKNLDTLDKDVVDLSEEDVFKEFIKNSLGYNTIDKNMPYYRWSINFTYDEMSEAINLALEERMRVSSEFIKEVDEDGRLHDTEITDLGQIETVKIIERSSSGVVKVLEIKGANATIQVSGQTNIRNIISPVNQQIIRQDGKSVTGWTSLPSPYYYVEETEEGFTVYGGGFGHGVGMSQSGAEILAQEGYNYKYILRHYYSYIDFSSIYIVESKKDEE